MLLKYYLVLRPIQPFYENKIVFLFSFWNFKITFKLNKDNLSKTKIVVALENKNVLGEIELERKW